MNLTVVFLYVFALFTAFTTIWGTNVAVTSRRWVSELLNNNPLKKVIEYVSGTQLLLMGVSPLHQIAF